VTDRLVFGPGIAASDISYVREGKDLLLTVAPTGETVRLLSWFDSSAYQLDAIEFADGGSLDLVAVDASVRVLEGDADANTIGGYETDETLLGYGGDDTLSGNSGDDRLEGGSDTYLFVGADIGSDSINDYNYNDSRYGGVTDIALFEGVSSEELWFSRNGDDLQINIIGTDSQVSVSGWYDGGAYQLDSIQADSSILLSSQVDKLVEAMSAFSAPVGFGSIISQEIMNELQPIITDVWDPR